MPTALGRAIARFAEPVYRWAITRVNRNFDQGKRVFQIDRPVISVGNLSVGGTGKTPMVMHVVRILREAGRWPCVAMRGYGAAPAADGSASHADEAQEYRRAFPDLPIVAQADRFAGLLELFAAPDGDRIDCVVLDDGFQHRRIARQLDVVLVDATRSPFEDRLLPAGWLREPVGSLARAQVIVFTHAEAASESVLKNLEAQTRQIAPKAVLARASHEWAGLTVMERNGQERAEPATWLNHRDVFAACAIGNPEAFLSQVDAFTRVPRRGTMVLRDHDPYDTATMQRLLRESAKSVGPDGAVVVTEKDWSKLRRIKPEAWPCAVVRPVLRMGLANDAAITQAIVHAARPLED